MPDDRAYLGHKSGMISGMGRRQPTENDRLIENQCPKMFFSQKSGI
jgi:hypothetical protein